MIYVEYKEQHDLMKQRFMERDIVVYQTHEEENLVSRMRLSISYENFLMLKRIATGTKLETFLFNPLENFMACDEREIEFTVNLRDFFVNLKSLVENQKTFLDVLHCCVIVNEIETFNLRELRTALEETKDEIYGLILPSKIKSSINTGIINNNIVEDNNIQVLKLQKDKQTKTA